MAEFTTEELDRFAEAIQSLKLYRRAELESAQGEDLIEKLYVDPLPHDHVHKQLRRPNTTLLIGRKGTGKSTVFLRAQKSLLNDKNVVSTYVDIKTVFESAQADPGSVASLASVQGALNEDGVNRLMLMTSFLKAVIEGIRDDIKKQLQSSFKLRMKETFTGSYDSLSTKLDAFVRDLESPAFVDVQAVRASSIRQKEAGVSSTNAGGSIGLTPAGPAAEVMAGATDSLEMETESSYAEILLRTIDLRELIAALKAVLEPLHVRHLFIFVDDFSELPPDAMRTVVDALIAPLNNWSDELVKFKIAAYPGRIYYGALDKSKIDEVSLDLHSIYGQSTVADMEDKAVEFTKRLVERRLGHFGLESSRYIDPRNPPQVWIALFQASLGNPRTLGYILFFAYEAQLLYGRRLTVTGVRDAAKKYYEDKLEPYFAMGAFLHESFDERSTIFSLKELLETLVNRARALRAKDASSIFKTIEGQHPTSHFNVSPSFDSLLSTLELNFFVTRYYVMSNRDGRRVSIYALNYGLCEKYSITFGRPTGTREQRLYFVERVFDYNTLFQDFIASNQEIRCSECGLVFEAADLEALKRFAMLCPECRRGTCTVTNISRKYADIIEGVNNEQLLPPTELGILQTLNSEGKPLLAGDIAGELDVSYQLVGKRAKRLDEQSLIDRDMVRGRREYKLSDEAKRVYFDGQANWALDVAAEGE
jgi:DNA-binding MarR family transcriptional regulator